MKFPALAFVLLASTPAVALQGVYSSADGSLQVTVRDVADDGVEVVVEGSRLGAAEAFTLYPSEDRNVLAEQAVPLGWFERLMGRKPERLPFDGERLAFARHTDDQLVLTTLQVDAQGNPTLDRVALVATGPDALFEHQRFTRQGSEQFETIELVGVQP